MRDWGMSLDNLVGEQIAQAVRHLRDLTGFSALEQPGFWENWVSTQLGGETTSHQAEYDVDVEIWGRDCRVEVKFSSAFWMSYAEIDGKDWSRFCFKWALPRGNSGKHSADCIVLVGLDVNKQIYFWVLPLLAVSENCSSITIATPEQRRPGTYSAYDRWLVPAGELLPAVADVCHNRLDMPMRQRNAKATRDAKKGQGTLMEVAA